MAALRVNQLCPPIAGGREPDVRSLAQELAPRCDFPGPATIAAGRIDERYRLVTEGRE